MFSLQKDCKAKMQVVRKEELNIEKQLHFLSEADEIYV